MSISVPDILDKCYIFLEDTYKTRWSEATLVKFINDALVDLLKTNTDINTKYNIIALTTGIRQNISTNALKLLDIVYNTNSNDTNQGTVPIRVKRATLDFTNPEWTQSPRDSIVKFYAYDMEDPNVFFIYPPNNGTGYVLAKEAVFLTPTTSTGTIAMPKEYELAIVYFVCFSAFLMDVDTNNTDKISLYKTLYKEQLADLNTADNVEEQKNAT
jgi:hypothetical protein